MLPQNAVLVGRSSLQGLKSYQQAFRSEEQQDFASRSICILKDTKTHNPTRTLHSTHSSYNLTPGVQSDTSVFSEKNFREDLIK